MHKKFSVTILSLALVLSSLGSNIVRAENEISVNPNNETEAATVETDEESNQQTNGYDSENHAIEDNIDSNESNEETTSNDEQNLIVEETDAVSRSEEVEETDAANRSEEVEETDATNKPEESGETDTTDISEEAKAEDLGQKESEESIVKREDVITETKIQLKSTETNKLVTNSTVDENVVVKGNTKYFLDDQGSVLYAEFLSGDQVVKIQEYFPNSTIENAEQRIRYIFNLNIDGDIVKASKLNEKTQNVSGQYDYYPNTIYGSHAKSIKYKYSINSEGYVTKATKREKGTQRILAWYVYYPKTKYGIHSDKILYKYAMNSAGYVTKATKRAKGTQKILAWYVYYPKTKYGVHTNKIMYKYWVNSAGYITKAAQMEKTTQRTLTWYVYHPKTRYGSHADKILYKYWLNSSGYVTKAVKREKGTQRSIAWFEYHAKTHYGKHASSIRYKLYMNSAGYVSTGTKMKKGSQQVIVWYKFKPKTVYGKQWKQVSERKINVPIVEQLPELPTGCEITAVTMMLQYEGSKVDKLKLAKEMPRHSWNPRYGYVGNPFTTRGWTVYPEALTGLVEKYSGNAENLTGYSLLTLEYYLSKNKPVVVWVSPMHGFSVHAITLTGYDKDNFYYNDPWTGGKNVKMNKAKFNRIWSNQSKRAISY